MKNLLGLINLFSFLVIIIVLDFFDFDNWLYQFILLTLKLSPKPDYDFPFWIVFGAVGSVLAAIAALRANEAVKEQIGLEQESYVVLKDNILLGGSTISICLKNIGRGLATFIRVSFNLDEPKPLFRSDQPHSIYLAGKEESEPWVIDTANLKVALSKQLGRQVTLDDARNLTFEDIFKECPSDFQFKMFISSNLSQPKGERVFVVKLAHDFLKEKQKPGVLGKSGWIKDYALKVMEVERIK